MNRVIQCMLSSRACFVGCGVALVVAVIGVVLLVRWWTAPIDIPRVPPPTYPTPNAFVVYRKLAEQVAEQHEKNTALRMTFDRVRRSVDSGKLSVDSEIRRYLQTWQPTRQEYRKHLNEPCMTILSYDVRETFPYLRGFRLWAYVEAADALLAIRGGDYRRALDDYETVLRVGEGLSNGGLMVHHLVARVCQNKVSQVMVGSLQQMPLEYCDELVAITRRWERVRIPPEQAWEHERIAALNLLHDLYEGKVQLRNVPGRLLNLRAAAHEFERLYRLIKSAADKPIVHQASIPDAKHPVLVFAFPAISANRFYQAKAGQLARNRLLAIAAAVRAYRLRHGKYPSTLAEAGVADLNKDPFTGGEFVYRTSPKGFLVYSVGEDGRDDGGKRAADDRSPGDIGLIPYTPSGPAPAQQPLPPGPPVWMK
ncbi:MAG: hypothetical protein RMM08_03220 [Armatimonadota bacterium]|nr:type II secretion system protein GspG [bacterium]MDW8320352.1 hypothetical protein [Armatimonadota bacterium]